MGGKTDAGPGPALHSRRHRSGRVGGVHAWDGPGRRWNVWPGWRGRRGRRRPLPTRSGGSCRRPCSGRTVVEDEASAADRNRAIAEANELRLRLDEERELLADAEQRLGDTFKALAAEALAANNQGFMALAKKAAGRPPGGEAGAGSAPEGHRGSDDTGPESLDKVDGKYPGAGARARRGLRPVDAAGEWPAGVQEGLENQTVGPGAAVADRARALGEDPSCAGRWRACSSTATSGSKSPWSGTASPAGGCGPTCIVRLPAGRQVVVDAKVPLEGYLQAMEATSDEGSPDAHAGARRPGAGPPAEAFQGLLGGAGRHAGVRRDDVRRGTGFGAAAGAGAELAGGGRGCCWPRRPP